MCRCRNTVLSKREYNKGIVWNAVLGVRQSESLSKCLSAKTPWLLHFSPNISPVPLLLLLEVQQLICIRKKMGKEWHSYISIGHVCFSSWGDWGHTVFSFFKPVIYLLAFLASYNSFKYHHVNHAVFSRSCSHPGRIWKVIFLFLKGHLRTLSCIR